MEKADYLDALDRESESFMAASGATPLDTPVVVCGDWTLRDLVAHQGGVWSFATANVAAASTERTPAQNGKAPERDTDVPKWLADVRADMLQTMQSANPTDHAWTFAANDQSAGFWLRRMTHETLVHRWDAQSAAGTLEPMYPELARDGIAEYTEVGLRYSTGRPDRTYPTGSLHLHCTDVEGEWILVGTDGPDFTVTHEHGKGDAAVRGPAQSLLLWLWNRPADDVQIFGDNTIASTWRALAP